MKKTSFSISPHEFFQLAKAWFFVSLAFGILLNKGIALSPGFFFLMGVSAVTVGLGFLLHEMAHKVVALRYGCRAEFRSFDFMLVLAVLMSFFGWILAAPGAVFIQGNVNSRKNGIISAVGPLMNILLTIIFFIVLLFTTSQTAGYIAFYGMEINAWLALFNLIPIMNLDGTKVLQWSKAYYFILLAFSFFLVALPYLLPKFLNNNF
ncbi:hypothetical protein HYY72_03815 [Candidatus Woesearchaeota archaeon]|nr:hypothetical protein [Candidatus Woesearchaeota archaeon]